MIKGHPTEMRFTSGDIKREWTSQGDVEVILFSAWAQTRNQIRSVLEASNIVTLAGNAFPNESEKDPRYYIENAPGSLRPGEWRLDRQSGTVTYWPENGRRYALGARRLRRDFIELARLEGQVDKPLCMA